MVPVEADLTLSPQHVIRRYEERGFRRYEERGFFKRLTSSVTHRKVLS